MIEEIKNKINKRISELGSDAFVHDYVMNILSTDHIGDFKFNSGIKILPYELVEKNSNKILQDDQEYQKRYNPDIDPFYIDWKNIFEGYWKDKLKLLELYTTAPAVPISPMESYKDMSALIKKIECRALLLVPEVKSVTQKQMRLSGEKKEYGVLRSYWIDEKGEKKRLISRHIGERHENLTREMANLFFNRGYGVLLNYRSDAGKIYDMVIERDRMKSVVEIKYVDGDIFDRLFLFDELLKRFTQEYLG